MRRRPAGRAGPPARKRRTPRHAPRYRRCRSRLAAPARPASADSPGFGRACSGGPVATGAGLRSRRRNDAAACRAGSRGRSRLIAASRRSRAADRLRAGATAPTALNRSTATRAPLHPKPSPQLGVAEQPPQRVGQRLRVAGRHQQTGTSCSTASGMPACRDATTGTPSAIASRTTFGNPSESPSAAARLGTQTASAPRIRRRNSALGSQPANSTLPSGAAMASQRLGDAVRRRPGREAGGAGRVEKPHRLEQHGRALSSRQSARRTERPSPPLRIAARRSAGSSSTP